MEVGAILSGVGSVLGGASGLFRRKKPKVHTPSPKDTRDHAYKSVEGRVRAARNLGLHASAGLGVPSSFAPSPTVIDQGGVNPAGALAEGVRGVGDAVSAYQSGRRENAALQRVERREQERHDAEMDLLRAQTHRVVMESAAALRGGPGGSINLGDPEGTVTGPRRTTHADIGGKRHDFEPGTSDASTWQERLGDVGSIPAQFAIVWREAKAAANPTIRRTMSEIEDKARRVGKTVQRLVETDQWARDTLKRVLRDRE